MNERVLLAHYAPHGLADWTPLFVLLGAFTVVVALLAVSGRATGRGPVMLLRRISAGLERVTGIPGWAAALVGTSSFGLLVAGMGFYNDVAWHVALGRDEELFTAPHTLIVIGLGLIALAAVLGVAFASVDRVSTRLGWKGVRVPWATVPLGLLGASALAGFPMDEVWHQQYGIDVTMWSPTHLLMIVGASLSPLASWLALAEAGVRPRDGRWKRGVYVLVAVLTLLGLSSVQGEFAFGVPQFQQLYHPVLAVLAGSLGLTLARLTLGRGWALGTAGIAFLISGGMRGTSAEVHLTNRSAAIYLGSALAVEVAAWIVGTEHRRRFALAAGLGVSTIGLGVEWVWNQGAHQPWTAALLPDALLVGIPVAMAAALVGTALAGAVRHEVPRIGGRLLAVAGVVALTGLAVPLPRTGADVRAAIDVTAAGRDRVMVEVTLDPPRAADDARWFQTIAWQGGGFVAADMRRGSGGRWVTEEPVPVGGSWKTIVRLHRGAELVSAPVWFPADPEIDAPEIPVRARGVAFEPEQRYLLREQHAGPAWYAAAVYAILGLIGAAWIGAFALGATRVRRTGRPATIEACSDVSSSSSSRSRSPSSVS